jgi:DNA repair protein RadD
MTFVPRPHQTKGVQTLVAYDKGRFSVAEVAVAGGKSFMLALLAAHYSMYGRVVILAHTKELVQQNAAACRTIGLSPGICSASIGSNAFARVTVGTIQTVGRRLHLFKDVVAILVDEVHLVAPGKQTFYRKLFERVPNARVHGVTGTPFRADGTGDLSKTFGPIIFRYTFLDALRDGFVKPLVPVDAGEDEQINVDGLKTIAGDFDLDEMAPRAIQLSGSHAKTTAEVMRKWNRRRVLVFACSIKHVDALEKEFKRLGVSAVGVHSLSIDGKRDKAVQAFRLGQVDVLVSCAMFTTGFDVPDIDMLVFARATKSAVYYAQGLGRGARLTPYAANCLVLDFGGNTARHGTLDAVAAAPGRSLDCDIPTCAHLWETWEFGRTCPKCQTLHRSAPKCKSCDEQFDPHYHGMRCPHCGSQQADLRKCAACEETYAAFLHPICPFCQYDNSALRKEGKELKSRGEGGDVVNVKAVIEKEPWQPIVAAPVKNESGGWLLATKYTVAIWPYEQLPDVHAVYLKRAANGRYTAAGIYDKSGHVHQR